MLTEIKMVYLAIAYRYGWSNGHWYVVFADTDKDKVLAIAELETHDRAGKYGVQVTCDDEIVAYFPSSRGESRPLLNVHVYADRHIGSWIRNKPYADKSEIDATIAHWLEIAEMIQEAETKGSGE